MVKGGLYATAGTRCSIVALDAATGELLRVHTEQVRLPLRHCGKSVFQFPEQVD